MMTYILSLMAPWMFNPFTGNFDYYQAGSGSTDPGSLVSNLLLQDGDDVLIQDGSFLLLQ